MELNEERRGRNTGGQIAATCEEQERGNARGGRDAESRGGEGNKLDVYIP